VRLCVGLCVVLLLLLCAVWLGACILVLVHAQCMCSWCMRNLKSKLKDKKLPPATKKYLWFLFLFLFVCCVLCVCVCVCVCV
jgi:hypothetical protein